MFGMASFYAELQVAGATYPVRFCTYEFTQATSARGRAVAKVRHGLVHLTLNVPDDDTLLDWAATPYKPLAGQVIFYGAQGSSALETLAWEAGHCVGYQEEFEQGNLTQGAYVCHLTIAAPKLTMQPGGPATYVSPAPGEHGSPSQALVNPLVVPLLTPAPVMAPVLETAAEIAAVTVLAPVILTLALILASTTPAGGPGIPQPHLVPLDPNLLRLNNLAAKHAAGTLTSEEEAELIALLAKVKGIHIQRLSDLNVRGPLRGDTIHLPGFHNVPLTYIKRTDEDREALRRKFDSSARKNFLEKIGSDPAMKKQLQQAGFDDKQIELIASGKVPSRAWQVHHKLPLDDGGDNSFDNLMLIKNDPYHQAITNLQNSVTNGMQAGDTLKLQWPVYKGFVYPATKASITN